MRPFRLDELRPRRAWAFLDQLAPRAPPGLGPPLDACHLRVANLSEKLSRPQRTEAPLADHVDGTVARQLLEPGGKIGLGQVDGPRNVPMDELLRFAHVDENRLRWAGLQLF